ncbi:MAG: cytochrome c peroxidase [Isosphaeraceae bacterium]|nr:cytochrome c peroxidase [Isosphaeraceae bacterium]
MKRNVLAILLGAIVVAPAVGQEKAVPKFDVSQIVESMKAESKGDSLVPNYLWMPSDASLINDEPLNVAIPLGLTPITGVVPLSNPMTKKKVALGKQLYFDARVSKDSTVSCATCHNPLKGWTDQMPVSTGIFGQKGGRSAPTVLNTVYGRTMFWDGRAPSLEGQMQGPPQNPIEMGTQTHREIVERLRAIPGYQQQFKEVFGTEVTLDGMAKAVAAFERTALSGNSRYDKYDRGQEEDTLKLLTESEKRGMVLFGLRLRQDDEFDPGVTLKKANCTSCHAGQNFTDELFHNLGVGFNAATGRFADLGRFTISPIGAKNAAEIGAFKTPTVRDVTRTAPYMHDGSEATLEAVVEYYDRGGNPNPFLDKDMKPLGLTAQEKADLVAFMKALTSEEVAFEMPTLPPDADGKTIDPRAALTPPAPKAALGDPHAIFVR